MFPSFRSLTAFKQRPLRSFKRAPPGLSCCPPELIETIQRVGSFKSYCVVADYSRPTHRSHQPYYLVFCCESWDQIACLDYVRGTLNCNNGSIRSPSYCWEQWFASHALGFYRVRGGTDGASRKQDWSGADTKGLGGVRPSRPANPHRDLVGVRPSRSRR